jgi:hypothetical protein
MNAIFTQEQSDEAKRQHGLALDRAAAEAYSRSPNADRLDTSLTAAAEHAARSADEFMIPQTIFRTPETSGWWHTNTFASVLSRAEVFATILPARFFQ